MPIYEYACEKCELEFEVDQRITEDPVKTCPECRSRRVKRLISKTSFLLKGGGWHSDLYSSPGEKDKAEKSGDSGEKSVGSDAKPDSKPDSKSDSKPSKSDSAPKSGSRSDSKKTGSKGAKAVA